MEITSIISLFAAGVIGITVKNGLSNGFNVRHYIAIVASLLWIIVSLTYAYIKDKNEKTSQEK